MDLKKIIMANPASVLHKSRIRGLFNDVFKNDIARVNLLMMAYDIGIVDEFRKCYPVDPMSKGRLKKVLVQQYSIVDDKAVWTIDTWASCFNADIIQRIADAEAAELLGPEPEPLPEPEFFKEPDDALVDRDDLSNFYINPSLKERSDRIFIPCGVGKTDKGFFIKGIEKQNICNHQGADIFALVYNYLVRNTTITDDDIPRYIQKLEGAYAIDYKSVFRFAIVLLQMVKNNMATKGTLTISFSGELEHLEYAVGLINHYASLFSRIIGYTEPVRLSVVHSKHGHKLSLYGKSGIRTEDNNEFISNARELWYEHKIPYHLTRENLRDLEYILSEISPFGCFREGQFEALQSMLAARKHSVCIMPTGSGKSLIYYMASLLQPLPMFVVAPTDILIQDQIRNLKTFHHIDNVAHLQLTGENSFKDYDIHNSLNFITPMTLQNRHLLVKFRHINNGTTRLKNGSELRVANGPLVSYIVLDEIHCLSNWGHDFRPEYLMLSRYLNKYLDQITLWGFTATANYTVVEDVQKQLDIPQQNFFSPISFEKYNISYDYRCVKTPEEMLAVTGEIARELISRNERTIIFTKNDKVSQQVADVVGWEADIFSSDNPEAYHHFVDGKCRILIASEELGIGINFPNITSIIHHGLPLSKSEYVQEIGRAGRANEYVHSYVVFLEDDDANVPAELLMRNTPIDDIPGLLDGLDNDYADIYRKLTNNCPTKKAMYERLLAFYRSFDYHQQALYVNPYRFEDLAEVKQNLFMLYSVGFVNDWYSYNQSKDGSGVDVLVDICCTDTESYRLDPTKMLRRMKKHARDYYEFLGNNRESIAKTDRASTAEEIIKIYVEWYYLKYLYHHNEQFLDLFSFIKNGLGMDSEWITSQIKDHFSLPFIKLKSDEVVYGEMPIQEIIRKSIRGISQQSLANIERINSNRYSYKFDYMLLCAHLRESKQFEGSRLERVLSNAPAGETQLLKESVLKIYKASETTSKLSILNYLKERENELGISYKGFLSAAYADGEKDMIYYGILAARINKGYSSVRRNDNV